MKYVYGPAKSGYERDSVIASNFSGRIEAGIGLERLTTIPMPCRGALPTLRARVKSVASSAEEGIQQKPVIPRSDPISILKNGLSTVRHHKRGWLKEDHLKSGVLDGTKEKLYARIWADYTAQQIYIQAQKDILDHEGNYR